MNSDKLNSIYRNTENTKLKVEASIEYLQEYLNTYKYSTCCDGNALVFLNDILYGLGVAINPEEYQYANGFSKFKTKLLEELRSDKPLDWKFGGNE